MFQNYVSVIPKLSMILDQKTGEGWKNPSPDRQTAQFGHTATLFENT